MKGHKPLVEMRLSGKAPKSIWVRVGPATPWHSAWHRFHESWNYAHVAIEPEDILADLDLRWAVGMWIMIEGEDHYRMTKLAEHFMLMRPYKVHINYGNMLNTITGDGEVYEFPIS